MGFEFPDLSRGVPIFLECGISGSHTQPKARTRRHSNIVWVGFLPSCLFWYMPWYLKLVSHFFWNSAVFCPSLLVTHGSLSASACVLRDVLSAEVHKVSAIFLSKPSLPAVGVPPMYYSKYWWDRKQCKLWCSLREYHLICSFPLWNSNIGNFPKTGRDAMGLSLIYLIPTQNWPLGYQPFT